MILYLSFLKSLKTGETRLIDSGNFFTESKYSFDARLISVFDFKVFKSSKILSLIFSPQKSYKLVLPISSFVPISSL